MTRDDLLALTEEVLTDLTNKGTVRRACRELDTVGSLIEERADHTVVVESDDGTRCELLADRPFADWPCTCLAGARCRHVVRAVLAYQRSRATAPDESPRDAVEPAPSPPPRASFDPASIPDDELASALGRRMAEARRLRAAGLLGQVGLTGGVTVVRLHHPVAVTVRFLVGADLRYVRCTCADPDPCAHVALAVEVARGRAFGETGLRQQPGDEWRPDGRLLEDVVAQLDQWCRAGVEAGEGALRSGWTRLGARLRQRELPHLADLVEELCDEQCRHAARSARFDPSRLVALAGELLARVESLRGGHDERIPDRLVAGSEAHPVELTRARLIGLGCQVIEHPGACEIVAHVVDARSGAAMRVRKLIDDDQQLPASDLARRLTGGIGIAQWGGGQVLVAGGRRDGRGNFRPGNRRVSPMARAALEDLSAPYLATSLAQLAGHQTRLPAVLDDRAAGTGLAVVRFDGVDGFGLDAATGGFVADLVDGDGARARLAFTPSARTRGGVSALAQWCRELGQRPDGALQVAGIWRWGGAEPVVEPTLLVAGQRSVQPQVADPVAGWGVPSAATPQGPLTSPRAVLAALDDTLGAVLLAGLDRIARDPGAVVGFARRARDAGSSLVAGLADRLAAGDEGALRRLLLLSAFGHALA